ncbi:hypothetical protein A8924_1478 [Saccharopolyspora erythraea NRRL 2338]|uniref:Uncharacterized protein n=2 Tax=Saccharopolyspora erythraea TaxID=1836 RepID=A4F8P2_SACEN|nr:hypothetical protein [Saccharopolyspora erythraea]EQD85985.1 hypothetical protein N599_11935 [Saccharopolyspora erythraea D]PFG94211.1 hypothetical protein A8924_1478 [Saccharopolyspora erythraea NRRL 2338]QRK90988.1 hypothetical protein JQX30_05935 [Saccharopolyspora erythraea]CAM00417.1 hypothetical protein SACE_1085 [Saccharopolyspora erythraea NRRL 2338]
MTSAEQVGFVAAKEGLAAIGKQTAWIKEQSAAGRLALDPEAAEKAAKHCEEEIEALQDLHREAQLIRTVTGLGDYPDGTSLTRRFKDKAIDTDAGALELIRLMQEELQKQADAFREAAKDYRATDEQISQDMQRGIK